jgi:hypothetical protein
MLKKILILGLVCASLVLAQGKGSSSKGGGGGNDAGIGVAPAANRFEKIAQALNLNKDQKKAVKQLLDDGAKEAAPLRDQISKSRVAVGEAVSAKKSDDELKQVARTSSDLSTQLSELELKTFAKIVASLDDTQKKDMRGLQAALVLMNDIYHTKNWNE